MTNFVLALIWKAKNIQKPFSKYLKGRIFKIRQSLNYKLMIINQNILAISSKSSKNIYETFYTKETTSKTAATEHFSKILNIKEISNNI